MFRVKNVPMFRDFAPKTGYFFFYFQKIFKKWTHGLFNQIFLNLQGASAPKHSWIGYCYDQRFHIFSFKSQICASFFLLIIFIYSVGNFAFTQCTYGPIQMPLSYKLEQFILLIVSMYLCFVISEIICYVV